MFADISVGDPWHDPPTNDVDAGRSLIVARTARGRALINAAINAGAIIAEPRPRDIIYAAQPNLQDTNAAVWGRRLAMRLMMMDVPISGGTSRFGLWWRHLGPKAKLQSVAGSLRRIWRQKLWQPVQITESKSTPSVPSTRGSAQDDAP
jgi:coenzyme F420 hydrogenase subunit beta